MAAGDYDTGGFVDLYVVSGSAGTNKLFRNLGSGKLGEVGEQAGVAISNAVGSGPTFADIDGDGHLDLFVGGVSGTNPSCFRNRGNGSFEDITATSGIDVNSMPTFSAAFGDFDLDGDLDLCLAHWNALINNGESSRHLWQNNGDGTFTDVSDSSGISALFANKKDFTFAPIFFRH